MAVPVTGFWARSTDAWGQVSDSEKLMSPAAERNKQPILEVLRQYLPHEQQQQQQHAEGGGMTPSSGTATLCVLEVACGSGQHTAHFAAGLPSLTFQPSDLTTEAFRSIAAHCQGLPNVLPPLQLDCTAEEWPHVPRHLTAITCINMCHISPFAATLGLLRLAEYHLKPHGLLYIYGPFTRNGAHTSQSNADFDASLRTRNAQWGYRDIGDVVARAAARSLEHVATVEMPANNFSLLFRRLPA